jgi:hypothetical protein
MRTLSIAEVGDVAGGFALDEAVVTASKYGFWDWAGWWGLSRPSHFYMDTFGADGYGGGGVDGGDAELLEENNDVKGFPVDHQKGLGVSEYQEAWEKVLSKMSAAELKAFSSALAKAATDAKQMKEGEVSDRLAQLAAAVLVGDSVGAGFASAQASDNLRGKSAALFEAFVTRSYATAAAWPGGI